MLVPAVIKTSELTDLVVSLSLRITLSPLSTAKRVYPTPVRVAISTHSGASVVSL